jgi:hypothetical protein
MASDPKGSLPPNSAGSGDGLNRLPRPGEPDSVMMAGMGAVDPAKVTPDPFVDPAEGPIPWYYFLDPVNGWTAEFDGVVIAPKLIPPAGFAPLNSPAFTGTPTAPTAAAGDNTTQIATDQFVGNVAIRVDIAQAFNTTQQAQALANAGAAAVSTPSGRLTLQTGTPVMTTSQAAKTTLFWTPYCGNEIPLFNGTTWSAVRSAEISVLTTDTTKNPAAIGANKVNDWFLWNDAGTLRLSHGPDWTNDTTRSAGTGLTLQDGIWLNTQAITNACAALRGTYVGTTRSNGTSTLDWIFGTAVANAGMASLYVWNMYNRVDVYTGQVQDTTPTWTYASATVRAFNGSATNRFNFVMGMAEDAIRVSVMERVSFGNTACAFSSGIGLDATNAFTGAIAFGVGAVAGNQQSLNAPILIGPQLGAHFVSACEAGDGVNTATLVGTNTELGALLRM